MCSGHLERAGLDALGQLLEHDDQVLWARAQEVSRRGEPFNARPSHTTARSCRTVQQMQPFIISMISSSLCILVFLESCEAQEGRRGEHRLGSTRRSASFERFCERHARAHQGVVNAHLSELVLDDRELLAVRRRQDVVEQRRLAAAEEAGEDQDGDLACERLGGVGEHHG